jgi:hypothetical protein
MPQWVQVGTGKWKDSWQLTAGHFFKPQNIEQEISNIEVILHHSAVSCSAV